ncbi:MAG: glycosyltransferase family 9 protein [Parachlamydiales bacterium]|jgi:hypothetical protein
MQAAILSSSTLGDGLLMLTAAFHLQQQGYRVVFFHRLMHELKAFFPFYEFQSYPENFSTRDLQAFDLVLMEYQKIPPIVDFFEKRQNLKNLFVWHPRKNPIQLGGQDKLFSDKKNMVQNILNELQTLLKQKTLLPCNGLIAPSHLKYQKYPRRILLAPTSNDPKKNWRRPRFFHLALCLRQKGFQPELIMAPHEKLFFADEAVKYALPLQTFPGYFELAAYIYESGFLIGNDSGPVHLASNLSIPTLTITGNKRKMRLWQKAFFPGKLLFPPGFLPNFCCLKIKDQYWPYFISVKKALKTFLQLYKLFHPNFSKS